MIRFCFPNVYRILFSIFLLVIYLFFWMTSNDLQQQCKKKNAILFPLEFEIESQRESLRRNKSSFLSTYTITVCTIKISLLGINYTHTHKLIINYQYMHHLFYSSTSYLSWHSNSKDEEERKKRRKSFYLHWFVYPIII